MELHTRRARSWSSAFSFVHSFLFCWGYGSFIKVKHPQGNMQLMVNIHIRDRSDIIRDFPYITTPCTIRTYGIINLFTGQLNTTVRTWNHFQTILHRQNLHPWWSEGCDHGKLFQNDSKYSKWFFYFLVATKKKKKKKEK